MEDYKLKLQVFEGPLDLLLHLVKINEMDIYDIKIAEVTRQYLDYIRLMQSLDLEVAGEFIVMAATLVNIKLRSLLPDTGEPEEEDEEIGDILTARALMEQLVQYRKFKEAASKLQEEEERQGRMFFREVALPQFAGVEDDGLRGDLDKMLVAFSRVLRFVEARGWHMVTEEEFSVEEKIATIHERIQSEKQVDIENLFQECRSKVEMIVVLLALLELCRQKSVALKQGDPYGPVHIYLRDVRLEEAPKEQKDAIRPEDQIPDRPSDSGFDFEDDEEEDIEDEIEKLVGLTSGNKTELTSSSPVTEIDTSEDADDDTPELTEETSPESNPED